MAIAPMIKAGASALPGAGKLPFLPGGGGEIPERELHAIAGAPTREALADYARVCGFTLKETLPPTWPHIEAFGLHMALITDGSFPFGPLGLVHVANEITQHRPIEFGELLEVGASPTPLADHPKGMTFSIVTEVHAGDELVWTERSTMLRRGRPAEQGNGAGKTGEGNRGDGGGPEAWPGPPPASAWWKLPSDLGARYAAVSGDSNPIHMHSLTAKPFGFPSAIAHGMWTKARCLAGLESALPDAFTVEVEFGKPILLPNRVGFGSRDSGGEIEIAVVPRKPGSPYLTGRVRPLEGERGGSRTQQSPSSSED